MGTVTVYTGGDPHDELAIAMPIDRWKAIAELRELAGEWRMLVPPEHASAIALLADLAHEATGHPS